MLSVRAFLLSPLKCASNFHSLRQCVVGCGARLERCILSVYAWTGLDGGTQQQLQAKEQAQRAFSPSGAGTRCGGGAVVVAAPRAPDAAVAGSGQINARAADARARRHRGEARRIDRGARLDVDDVIRMDQPFVRAGVDAQSWQRHSCRQDATAVVVVVDSLTPSIGRQPATSSPATAPATVQLAVVRSVTTFRAAQHYSYAPRTTLPPTSL
uniref:Uncharacterized protein n=1 Tax=Plectus sambesii TaxID=2011161 RepID=A0A914VYH0_9BILA